MQEFDEFLKECNHQFVSIKPCVDSCTTKYCLQCKEKEGNCTLCLKEIHKGAHPSFTYRCKKITYHYALQFFNRFASEIDVFLRQWKSDNRRNVFCISLGCGPGSEVFGIIDAFRTVAPNFTLYYQGYDLNPIWQDIQRLSQSKLSKTEHKIEFFTTNLFVDCHDNGMKIDLLIFNYLLSDAVKFMTFTQRIKFLEEIKTFVIDKRIKVLIFNDINYYGNCQKLDSGIQMFKELFSLIKVNNKVKKCNCSYFCFPEDPYRGSEKWEYHKSNHLIFSISDFNSVVSCNSKCRSKQALIKIEYK